MTTITRTHSAIIIMVAMFMLNSVATNQAAAQHSNDNAAAQINIKQTPTSKLVYVDHVGPYWNLSHTVEALTSYMKQHQQHGSIVIRYNGHPQSEQFLRSLRVGFQPENNHEPLSPYQLVIDEPSWVVYATISAGSLSPTRAYTHLREWAQQHNLEVIGPMTEIYEAPHKADPTSLATVEVQLGVRKNIVPLTEAIDTAKALPQPAVEPDKPTAQLSINAQTEPIEIHTTPTHIINPITQQSANKQSSQQQETTHESAPTITTVSSTPTPHEKKVLEPSTPKFASTTYEPVADLLFSTFAHAQGENQKQLTKLVSRIQAIAVGADKRYPNQALPLKQFAHLMTQKLSKFQNQLPQGIHSSEAGGVEKTFDPHLSKAIKQLETVMVNIGYRTISPSQALLRILTIIRQTAKESENTQMSDSKDINKP